MKNCRLIYRSVAVAEVVSNETLRDLETGASRRNENAGIKGLLLLLDRVFVQVLEGPVSEVNALYRRIAADTRHRDVELIDYQSPAEPLFNDWNMRLVDLYDLPGDKRALMSARYAGSQGEIEVPAELQRVYALLFDAQHLCTGTPWLQPDLDTSG